MSGMYICCICDDECGYYTINRINKKNSKLCRVFLPRHSAKQLFFYLLEKGFTECIYLGTRRSLKLCRVPDAWHSAKSQTSPSAMCGSTWQSSKLRRKCHVSTRQRPVSVYSFIVQLPKVPCQLDTGIKLHFSMHRHI